MVALTTRSERAGVACSFDTRAGVRYVGFVGLRLHQFSLLDPHVFSAPVLVL